MFHGDGGKPGILCKLLERQICFAKWSDQDGSVQRRRQAGRE
jgi:hypothetical protein